ncbi:GSU0071 family protein [Geobacter sp. DSM 9736]|uniref:GSU0071 family protein n=1 Tax=Geobacter sp. DSM 9736 TaxID=1277350 RepID=UPI000B5DD408|nr:hypothetical protein SAMN06269301_3263 [Geobacter sp. DSM 9736]
MNVEIDTIDEAIDKYVLTRKEKGVQKARERFLAYVYMRHGGDDQREFLGKVRGLTRYYIDYLKVMENPFKGPEVAWFASMVTIAVYSIVLMATEGERTLGICLLAGTLANAWFLLSTVAKKWCDIGVMIAIYREIVELTDKEMAS